MRKKRIILYVEANYAADDVRELEELKTSTVVAVALALEASGGTLAKATIVGASVDPGPEPTAENVIPVPPVSDPL